MTSPEDGGTAPSPPPPINDGGAVGDAGVPDGRGDAGSGRGPPPPPSPPPPDGEATCNDGNGDPLDACIDGRPARCGDRLLHLGVEECESGFGEGWTDANCVACRRARFEVCERHDQCAKHSVRIPNGESRFDLCINGLCAPFACDVPQCMIPCPSLGGFDVQRKGPYCLIVCASDPDCPVGARCDANSRHCVSQNYSPETFDPLGDRFD